MLEKRTNPFIKSIQINKVRHLENFTIDIDDTKARHLILTGPNGCGKTSLLVFLKRYLEGGSENLSEQISDIKSKIADLSEKAASTERERHQTSDEFQQDLLYEQEFILIRKRETLLQQLEVLSALFPQIHKPETLKSLYSRSECIIAFFEAKRSSQFKTVSGIGNITLEQEYDISVNQQSNNIYSSFVQYLVNQVNKSAILARTGDNAGATKIDNWLAQITKKFQQLFQNDELQLKYDIDNFDFKVVIPGREPFSLVENQLSDGFSSAIQIVSELLLRMEAISAGQYDMPGIVLIDEIETHLHIELQKEVLPFLTDFFPNIQFIVTTHSPFVITSLPNAVIYDLETHKREENMAPLSASSVIEEYFDSDLYSAESKRMVDEYAKLSALNELTPSQKKRIDELRSELELIEYDDAPELVAQYQYLRAQEKHS